MNHIELEVADWLYRLLGLCYIEDNLGKKVKNKEEFKKDIHELKKLAIDSLRQHYESAKNNEDFRKLPIFEVLQNSFEKNKDVEDIDKAKQLLIKHGFTVTKKVCV